MSLPSHNPNWSFDNFQGGFVEEKGIGNHSRTGNGVHRRVGNGVGFVDVWGHGGDVGGLKTVGNIVGGGNDPANRTH